MAIREINNKHGRLGTIQNSASYRATKYQIGDVIVYRDSAGTIGVRINRESGGPTVLTLRPNAAVEIAKGILANLPAVYIAADDELLEMLKSAVGLAQAESKAVFEAISRPLQPKENKA